MFVFNLTVLNGPTRIQTDFINNTQVYYGESSEFAVFHKNTQYNENITFNGLGPITINESSKIEFLYRIDDLYWLHRNLLGGLVCLCKMISFWEFHKGIEPSSNQVDIILQR